MKITIKRGIKDGKFYCNCGERKFKLSRKLTNTTSESGGGIFNGNDTQHRFYYGDQSKEFHTFAHLDLTNDSASEIKKELQRRVTLVRAWVASIDYSEIIEFDID